VVDTYSRFSPAVVPRFRFRAPDVIEVLERVCTESGYRLRSGSTRAASSSPASSIYGPTWKAWRSTWFRAECLNQHWFMSLDDAVRKCEVWRRGYNEVRPHSAMVNKPPISLVNQSAAHGPPLPVAAGWRLASRSGIGEQATCWTALPWPH